MRFSEAAVKSLIQQGEGIALEFKRRINHPKKIGKSLVAFANTLGGFLILGVDDNGYVYGIEDEKYPSECIERITIEECSPPVHYNLFSLKVDGKYIILVEVPESKVKPHYLKKDQTAYLRVGDKSIAASQVQLFMMKEAGGGGFPVEFGEPERILFDYLSAYGTISVQKFSNLSGLNETESTARLSRLISIGMIKPVFVERKEYYCLA